MSTADLLADCWDRWATDLAALLDAHWRVPTRRAGWDVLSLAAHAAPDLGVLRDADEADPADAVSDPALLLHEHEGTTPPPLEPVDAHTRFAEAAAWLRAHGPDPASAKVHPTLGPVTVQALLDAALADTVAHHDDLCDVITRPPVPEDAEQHASEVLG